MLSFDTTRPYSFEVDGSPYTIPFAQFSEAEDLMAEYNGAEGDDKLPVVRTILAKRADKRTMAAIDTLNFKQVGLLFREWLGGEAGESSPSAN